MGKVCQNCGKELNENENFCSSCGKPANDLIKTPFRPAFNNKPSKAWYLIPFFFGLLGGIIAYLMVKSKNKEMARNLLIFGVLISFLVIAFLFIAVSQYFNNITFNFIIDQTQEPINGDVYFENEFLGATQNGKLSVDSTKLNAGNISIRGIYQNNSFNFIFYLNEEDLMLYHIDFLISSEDLNNLNFKASDINTKEIEENIFYLINLERKEREIAELKRSPVLDNIAKEYSNDMVKRDFYSHTSPEGIKFRDRLISKRIFYFTATENLNYLYVDPDTDVAEETVSGWINSPGHRIPILDTNDPIIWDNIGIGVSCTDLENITYGTTGPVCIITAEFARFNSNFDTTLKKNYVQYIDLYNPDLGLNFDVELTIKFSSDNRVNLYIVPNHEQYKKFMSRNYFDKIEQIKNTRSYTDVINAKPGYGLIIDASKSNSNIKYNLSLNYEPSVEV